MNDEDEFETLSELVGYLTPRKDNEIIKSYQNTTAVACPICSKSFDDLVVCKADEAELQLSEPLDICVTTDDEGRPFLFTHKK